MLAALAGGACDAGAPAFDDASRTFDRPSLNVLGVHATTGYEAGVPTRVALASDAITSEIELSSSFKISFDRFLWPKTVSRQAVCLLPGTATVTKLEECTGPGQPFTQPEYDPVERSVVFRLPKGARLQPATHYRLTVLSTESADSAGFLAFDGAPLTHAFTVDFKTKSDSSTSVDELAATAERYCEAQACARACADTQKSCKNACVPNCASKPTEEERTACEKTCSATCATIAAECKAPCGCLDGSACAENGDLIGEKPYLFRGCGFSPCHATSTNPDPAFAAPAPLGLDLGSPGAIAATAIGVTAKLSQHGEAASIPDLSGARFGRAMPLIDPFNPGNSYLLYKLLINGRNFESAAPGSLLDEELQRLRAGAVAGVPMPAAVGPDTNQLAENGEASERELRLISAWIAAGAVLSCPVPSP